MIYGLETRPLPEGYIPLEAVAVIKCLDAEGEPVLLTRSTDMRIWDSVGMLTVALDQDRQSAIRAYEKDDDDA